MALRALAAAADPPGRISKLTCAFNRVCILVSAQRSSFNDATQRVRFIVRYGAACLLSLR
jgi:hypothetical protein